MGPHLALSVRAGGSQCPWLASTPESKAWPSPGSPLLETLTVQDGDGREHFLGAFFLLIPNSDGCLVSDFEASCCSKKCIRIYVKSIHIFLETAYSMKRKKVEFSLWKKFWKCLAVDNVALQLV